MIRIDMLPISGDFAEDKDAAASVRESQIRPAIERGEDVELDFTGVTLATQSFVHALLSDILRKSGEEVLDHLTFSNCQDGVKCIIATVVQYSLNSIEE